MMLVPRSGNFLRRRRRRRHFMITFVYRGEAQSFCMLTYGGAVTGSEETIDVNENCSFMNGWHKLYTSSWPVSRF